MAFPQTLDNFTNPTPSSSTASPVTPLSGQLSQLNNAVEAIEGVIGVTGSTVPTSLEYRLADVQVVAALAASDVEDIQDELFPVAPQSAKRRMAAAGSRPRVLIFGCSIAAQCASYMANQTALTSASAEALAGSTLLQLVSASGIVGGDRLAIPLHDGRVWQSLVSSVASNDVTLSSPLPALVRKSTSITKLNSPTVNYGKNQGVGAANGAIYLLGGPAEIVEPWGHGGGISAQMLPYLQKELRWYAPHLVILHLFENDMTGTVGSGAATLSQMQSIARMCSVMCLQFQAIPVVCSSMPYNLIPASRAVDYDGLVDYLVNQLPIDVPGAVGCDLSTKWLDTSNPTYPRSPQSGWTDGVHPNPDRRFDVAAFLKPVLQPLLPVATSWLDVNLAKREIAACDGSGGSLTGTVTGVAPTSWTISGYGTSIGVASKNQDGSLKIVGAWPGAADRTSDTIYARYTFTMPSNWPGSGRPYRVYVRFRLNTRTGIAQLYPQAICNGYGELHRGNWGTNHALSIPADGSLLMLEGPPFVPMFGSSTITVGFNICPTTAGSPANAAINIDILELGIVAIYPEPPVEFL